MWTLLPPDQLSQVRPADLTVLCSVAAAVDLASGVNAVSLIAVWVDGVVCKLRSASVAPACN
jgi:hypothetical protein